MTIGHRHVAVISHHNETTISHRLVVVTIVSHQVGAVSVVIVKHPSVTILTSLPLSHRHKVNYHR